MSEPPAPAGRKRKRPVVQHVTNNYNITNNYDHSVANNDNRVTNNTYNVRTTDKQPPRHWEDEKTKLPKTNVANVTWDKAMGRWHVRTVDAETRKRRTVGYKERWEWEDAVRLREEAQKKEGTKGPGELEFTAEGEAEAACGHCRHTLPIASFAPDPCNHAKELAQFCQACDDLGSGDADVAAEAEAKLAKMPGGNGGSALRRSWCRRCRDALCKSRMEGPDNNRAVCRAAGIAIREDMARRGCRDCSESRAECYELEHVGRQGKPEWCESILDYAAFAARYGHDGPDEMWKAYRNEHVVVLCMCCHARQPTHDAARAAHSSTLPEGSKARRKREYMEAKTEYNNWRKRTFVNVKDGRALEPGQCYHCEGEYECRQLSRSEIEAGEQPYERAFHWAHIRPETKHYSISNVVNSALSFKTGKERIDAEIDGTNGSGKCRLSCANCHHYHETLPEREQGVEEWDALMARPVRKRV